MKRRPYVECPECTSADVARSHKGDRCRRCSHRAAEFKRLPLDRSRFDTRPRMAGMILPTCREDFDA